jgi:hypothetical protein
MIVKNDWRLTNPAAWLTGATLTYGGFRQTSVDYDHAHCEFCMAKFMDPEYRAIHGYEIPVDVLTEGYHSEDGFRWICNGCFEDFHEMFGWRTLGT